MELQNLGKNILYRICEVLSEGDQCGPVATDLVYRSYADLPGEKVAASIHDLVAKGLLREARQERQLYLTDRGRSEIRTFIPERLWPDCDPSAACNLH